MLGRHRTSLFSGPLACGLTLLTSVVLLSGCSEAALSWSNALDHVGDQGEVCGPVAGMGRSKDDTFINLGKDYPDPGRFTIVVWDDADFRPPREPDGLRACASGKISMYDGVAQIEVEDGAEVDFFGPEEDVDMDYPAPGDGQAWTVLPW